jgi:hypothetical protein
VSFDDPRLVANSGLVVPATLMARLGLETLINSTLRRVGRVVGALPGRKILTLERWRDGDLPLRWAAAGMECAAEPFRRVKGYRRLPKLARAASNRHIRGETEGLPDLLFAT